MNHTMLSGILFRDPEPRISHDGKLVVVLALSTRDTADPDRDLLFEVETYEEVAELCRDTLSEGSQVSLIGYLKPTNHDGKGQEIHFSVIFVNRLSDLPLTESSQ